MPGSREGATLPGFGVDKASVAFEEEPAGYLQVDFGGETEQDAVGFIIVAEIFRDTAVNKMLAAPVVL